MADPDPENPDLSEQLEIDIIIRDPQWESVAPDVIEVCRGSAHAAYAAGSSTAGYAEAAVVLSDDDFVATLNRQYRGREGATNVLSFAATESDDTAQTIPEGMPMMLGDIIVARETTTREAENTGISVTHHLRHLVVHGMLHLLGYDHLTDDEAAAMEPLETEILKKLGVEDPYGTKTVLSMETQS